eukprot:Hpha_TRINITY_DN15509_c0_g3::TRINITY_DN15509_c0_g3_i1::g.105857::m.105857
MKERQLLLVAAALGLSRPVLGQCVLPRSCVDTTNPQVVNRADCLEGLEPTSRSLLQTTTNVLTSVLDDGTATTALTSVAVTTCALNGDTGNSAGYSVCEFTPVPGYECAYNANGPNGGTKFTTGGSFYVVCDNANQQWWGAAGPTGTTGGVPLRCMGGTLSSDKSVQCIPVCTPIACAIYTLAASDMMSGDTNPGPQCAASAITCGVDPTVVGYIPSDNCRDQCAISCAAGYHDPTAGTTAIGKGWLQCISPTTGGSTAAQPTIQCLANACSPFYLPSGTIGVGTNPCGTSGTTLYTDPSGGPNTCELQCEDGYGHDTSGTGLLPAQSVTCPPGSPSGTLAVSVINGVAHSSLDGAALDGCPENKCAPYNLSTTAQCKSDKVPCLQASSHSSTACAVTTTVQGSFVQLTAVTTSSCTLDCAAGFVQKTATPDYLTVTCPRAATHMQTYPSLSPSTWECWATCQVWFQTETCTAPRSVPVANAGGVTCPDGDIEQCTAVTCCYADCPIDISAQVDGVDVTAMVTTACVPGTSVTHGESCTWQVKRGYVCSGGTLTQTCSQGGTITQLTGCHPTCASYQCDTSLPEISKSKADAQNIVCTGLSQCTSATCCLLGCRVPQFGIGNTADIEYIGGTSIPPLKLSAACGTGLANNYYVNHSVSCTYEAITNAQCVNTGMATCQNGAWVGTWTYSALPSCIPLCGIEDSTTGQAAAPGLVSCPAPYRRKANAGTITCDSGQCSADTCCDADCPTVYTPGSWLRGVGCPNAMATAYGSGTQPVYHGTVCTWDTWTDWNCTGVGSVQCLDGTWYKLGTQVMAGLPVCKPSCSSHQCLGLLVPIDNPSQTECISGSCTDNLCCFEPCTVRDMPTYKGQQVATVTPTTCVPGNQVPHDTVCTWEAEPGFACTNEGVTECVNQIWTIEHIVCLPSCTVHNCAPTAATPPAVNAVQKVNASMIQCPQTGDCTDVLCCDAPCTVQSLPIDLTYLASLAKDVPIARVTMLTIDSQCAALLDVNFQGVANAAVSGTMCTWTEKPGYSCTGLGTTTCLNGRWTQDLPVCVPMCTSYLCGSRGEVSKTRAENCPSCLPKFDQDIRRCESGVCDDNNCCDAACTTPAEPATVQAGITTVQAALVAPCGGTTLVKHNQLCTWDVQPGYSCDNDDPWTCTDGSQVTVPQCYATCLNTGAGWNNAACTRSVGFLPIAHQADTRCGRDAVAPGDACTEDICCDFSCGHPAMQCETGYKLRDRAADIRCGASLLQCTSDLCCEPSPCPLNSGPPGQCECYDGYGAFPSLSWDPTFEQWTHVCRAMCDHPNGPCRQALGLVVKGPQPPMCDGLTSDNCTQVQCCDVACANPSFTACTGTAGRTLRDDAAEVRCGTSTSFCTIDLCCVATCSHVDFTTCTTSSALTGLVLKPGAQAIQCTTASWRSCNTSTCCDATFCSTYECSPGYSKRTDVATTVCGTNPSVPQVCTDMECCVQNICRAPTYSGLSGCYAFADGQGMCTTVDSCTPAACALGCNGIPTVTCDFSGADFGLTGCSENQCTAPARDYRGYTYAGNGDVCYSVTSCGQVGCADGYHFEIPSSPKRDAQSLQLDRSYSVPTCFCDVDGGKFLCLGCLENQCVPPANELFGYQFGGDRTTCTKVSTCNVQGCRTGYLQNLQAGPVSLACNAHGGRFEATGCDVVPCPAGAETTALAVCACKPGYRYIRVDGIKAPLWTGTEWLHQCARVDCPVDTLGDEQCRCKLGFVGSPTWDPVAERWTHVCTPAPCPANARRTCDANGICGCQCNMGFETTATSGQDLWDFNTQSWLFTCKSFCAQGYAYDPNTAQWDGSRWVYTCVEAPCPENTVRSSLPDGRLTCECTAPLEGVPLWNSVLQRWEHTCGPPRTSVACPTGSGPEGVCNCLEGYKNTGTTGATWDGTGWTHTCAQVECPANAAWGLVLASQHLACVCNPGYTGTPLWSVTNEVWLHTCTPVVGLNTGIVTSPTVTAGVPVTRTVDGHVTGISSATRLLTPQCGNTNPSLFSGQPRLNLNSAQTQAALFFTTQAAGVAQVTCVVTDSRNPAQTTSFPPFTIDTRGGTVVPPPTGSTVCTNGQCQAAFSPVTVQPGQRNVFNNYANVIPATSRVTTCSSAEPGLTPQIDSNGHFIGTVAAAASFSTTVTCNVADNGVQKDTFSFVAQTPDRGGGGTPGSGSGTPVTVQRVRVRLSQDFNKAAFADAISRSSSVPLSEVNVWYVCPVSACPGAACPNTPEARESAGCRAADRVSARSARTLQNAGEEVYVDFSVVPASGNVDSNQAQQRGANDLASTVTTCNAGGTCPLNQVGSQWSEVSLVPATAQPNRDDGDDSSLSTGAIIGIVIGCIVLCLLLILLIWCCCRKKKDKSRDVHEEHHHYHDRHGKVVEGDYDGDGFPDVNKSHDQAGHEMTPIDDPVDPSYDPYRQNGQNAYGQGAQDGQYGQGAQDGQYGQGAQD